MRYSNELVEIFCLHLFQFSQGLVCTECYLKTGGICSVYLYGDTKHKMWDTQEQSVGSSLACWEPEN